MTGILLDELSLCGWRRIGRLSKRFGRTITVAGFFKETAPLQLQRQLFEHRPHLRNETESFRREIHSDFRAHFAETSAKQRRGQIVLSGDRTFQAILSAS